MEMKRIGLMLLAFLLMFGLVGCKKEATEPEEPTWQEKYDLGIRYLSEGNYEQAIIAFTAAIEIDPKRVEAYASLADVYVAKGDIQAAIDVLANGVESSGNDALQSKLDELSKNLKPEPEPEPDSKQNLVQEEAKSSNTHEAVPVMSGEISESWGTLDLSNITYSYYEGSYYGATLPEGSVGMVMFFYTVDGPSSVRTMWYGKRTQDYTQEKINEELNGEHWKVYAGQNKNLYDKVPFETEIGFFIYESELGKTEQFLAIGLDENLNDVGYAVFSVQIPE